MKKPKEGEGQLLAHCGRWAPRMVSFSELIFAAVVTGVARSPGIVTKPALVL